jgi:hypothetical protein
MPGTFGPLKGKHLTRKSVLSHAHVINHRPVFLPARILTLTPAARTGQSG